MTNSVRNKYSLTFPAELAKKPYTYELVKTHHLVINIMRAKIGPREVGRMALEMEGAPDDIERGIEYLKSCGIVVDEIMGEMIVDRESCIDCGACLAVCPVRALALDPETGELTYDRGSCALCEHCVKACPLGAITSSL